MSHSSSSSSSKSLFFRLGLLLLLRRLLSDELSVSSRSEYSLPNWASQSPCWQKSFFNHAIHGKTHATELQKKKNTFVNLCFLKAADSSTTTMSSKTSIISSTSNLYVVTCSITYRVVSQKDCAIPRLDACACISYQPNLFTWMSWREKGMSYPPSLMVWWLLQTNQAQAIQLLRS